MPDENASPFRSGFVAIIGPPNAGKSTLLNTLLGQKIAITSSRSQTTRNRILGVLHRPSAQLVFIDTPGVHQAKKNLNVRLVDAALSAVSDVDAILFLSDLKQPDAASETLIIRRLKSQKKPVICGLNKSDLVPKEDILPLIARWSETFPFSAIVPVSAKTGDQVDALVKAMEDLLPEGPPYFPEDAVTDAPMRFIAAEIIREKVFRLTGREIPYATAVTVEEFSEDPEKGLVRIHAAVHVERDSQKGIIIGKKGAKLKTIGEQARKDIERVVGALVFLKLFVRVQKNWSRDPRALRKFGY